MRQDRDTIMLGDDLDGLFGRQFEPGHVGRPVAADEALEGIAGRIDPTRLHKRTGDVGPANGSAGGDLTDPGPFD